ncbi:MAG: MFS transporter [Woeseiaceae bacterium]|nr:MFS transporter [Woeseiaceae bacterium]
MQLRSNRDSFGTADTRVDRSLRHSLKDAAAFATMTGVGETYFSAFGLFLKATTPQIGLLASLPPLLASSIQLLSAWLGRLTGQRKAIVLSGASLQAFSLLPLVWLPLLFPDYAVHLLIAAVVVYQCGAHLAAPQWGSLMGDIVPTRRRGRFFARRTRVVSFMTFCSLIVGGLILQAFASQGKTLYGFVCIFGIALLARAVSVYHLAKMHDPAGHVAALEIPVGEGWWQRLRQSNFVRFSIFFALMQFSVAIASPFFTVYMLRDLEFSYAAFMGNTGMSIFVQFLTLNQWGRISDIFGNRRILATTGVLVPLMPLLWVFSTNYGYLLCIQALSGLTWAGFTLSAGNFLYDLISRDKRATYLAIHNVLASVGIFGGAMLGGYLGAVLPTRIEISGHELSWLSPLLGVFVISTLARMIIVLVLLPNIREVRKVRPISFSNLIFRVTRVNALAGLIFDIVGPRPKESEENSAADS